MPQSITQSTEEKLPTSGTALASIVLGFFFFIPLFGFLTGVVAVVLGMLGIRQVNKGNYRGKRLAITGIVLGIVGMLLTVGMYGFLIYSAMWQKTGPFAEMKPKLDQNLLTITAGALEHYKQRFQEYPSNLEDLKNAGYMIYETDAYGKEFHYAAVGSSYELRGIGADGLYGTADDTFALK